MGRGIRRVWGGGGGLAGGRFELLLQVPSQRVFFPLAHCTTPSLCSVCIYIDIYIFVCMGVCMGVYIYISLSPPRRKRERRERKKGKGGKKKQVSPAGRKGESE